MKFIIIFFIISLFCASCIKDKTPIPEFTATQTNSINSSTSSQTITSGLPVQFIDQSTYSPVKWMWKFGNGNSSTEQNPRFVYNKNGSYTVELTATNSWGSATIMKENYIVATGGPPIDTSFTDPRDGREYKIVKINNQWWMAENLAYLPFIRTNRLDLKEKGYSVYGYHGYDTSEAKASYNYQTYGVLYTWYAALEACPEGWHLPSLLDWTRFINFLISSGYNYDGSTIENLIGKALSDTKLWNNFDLEGSVGKNDYPYKRNYTGFSALPGGYNSNGYGIFEYIGYGGRWWSSTEKLYTDSLNAWYVELNYYARDFLRFSQGGSTGYSVRCVK